MPYTPAHVILAAPLWYGSRKQLPLPPLIVGCIAPDLPYLVHLTPVYAAGHTALGLLTHAVPQGLVMLGLWYLWLEKPMLELFALRPPKRQVSITWFLLVLLSLLLGAATHSLLDATSHETGWFVQRFAGFGYSIGGLPIFKWIQYGGGLIGLLGIAGWYLRGQRASGVANPARSITGNSNWRSRLTGRAILGLSAIGFACLANWVHQSTDLHAFAVNSASGIWSGLVFGACVYATLVQVQSAHRRES